MTDILSAQKRSEVMSKIRYKNTKPELLVRKLLSARGIRYRLHSSKLPGHPDFAFPRLKVVIQVNGCYGHNHRCRKGKMPATNTAFWLKKISSNAHRDVVNAAKMRKEGGSVGTFWECELKKNHIAKRVLNLLDRLQQMDRQWALTAKAK